MMKKPLIAAFAGVFLAGCLTTTKMVTLSSNFDAEQARNMIQPGTNTITGSALIRQQGGGVVTCAGFEVLLIPKTAYAAARFQSRYGNVQRGYNGISNVKIEFTPDSLEYHRLVRNIQCDAQGNFVFDDVADGEFFITTEIIWHVPSGSKYTPSKPTGGTLFQAISLSGGEHKKVVLSPH